MKKAIIWNENNKKRIEAELNEVQKRSRARTITMNDIQSMLNKMESYLDIPKKHLEGVKFEADWNAQNFPRAYKYSPDSTIVEGIYSKGKWRITNIYRYTTHREGHMLDIELTDEAKEALVDRFSTWG